MAGVGILTDGPVWGLGGEADRLPDLRDAIAGQHPTEVFAKQLHEQTAFEPRWASPHHRNVGKYKRSSRVDFAFVPNGIAQSTEGFFRFGRGLSSVVSPNKCLKLANGLAEFSLSGGLSTLHCITICLLNGVPELGR